MGLMLNNLCPPLTMAHSYCLHQCVLELFLFLSLSLWKSLSVLPQSCQLIQLKSYLTKQNLQAIKFAKNATVVN